LRSNLSFREVDVGSRHACGITTDRAQYCWGNWDFFDNGLGSPSPERIGSANNYASLTSGSWSACTLTTDAKVECWSTQTAHEAYGVSRTPAPAGGNLLYRTVTAGIAFGESYWCGLTTDGIAYCWGGNNLGELGDGKQVARATANQPVAVSGGLVFKSISSGYITCGVTSAGDVYCWGDEVSYPPFANNVAGGTVPTRLQGAGAFDTVSVGTSHVCGLTADGTALCWGANNRGQLGNGTTISGSNTPQAVSGGLRFRSISAGNNHTCAVTSDGAAYCWGQNDAGQLGDASDKVGSILTQFSRVPIRVHAPFAR
jgi:alpha-tubulin suppressor-like RCC1 family protein